MAQHYVLAGFNLPYLIKQQQSVPYKSTNQGSKDVNLYTTDMFFYCVIVLFITSQVIKNVYFNIQFIQVLVLCQCAGCAAQLYLAVRFKTIFPHQIG